MSNRIEVLLVSGAISSDDVADSGDVLTVGVSCDSWFWVFAIYRLVVLGGCDTRVDLLLSLEGFALCRLRLPTFLGI